MDRAQIMRAKFDEWRKEHPSCSDWSDVEVLEALLVEASKTNPEAVTCSKGADGKLRFTILGPELRVKP